ncbi:MAG: cytochrome-c peroxidase [Bacteroidia bacterium]
MQKFIFSIAVLAGLVLSACNTGTDVTPDPPVSMTFPSQFPAPVYQFSQNEVTDKGFKLGKALFYDPILSIDSTISCASCHQQNGAFAHVGHDLSHGVRDLLGTRNTPPIQNLAWHSSFFWDGGAANLDVQPLGPIKNPVEMDLSWTEALHRLRRSPTYFGKFKDVFNIQDTSELTTALLGKAFSQFMNALVSANAKYDKYKKGEVTLSAEETAGMSLFQQKCASCHKGELFSDFSYKNNGLKPSSPADSGRYMITYNLNELYQFKVPSLRNIEVSYPYMHDGRYSTLESVLNHYVNKVYDMPTLDPSLKQSGTVGIPLTSTEQANIIAFLKTLTDTEFLNDKRFKKEY